MYKYFNNYRSDSFRLPGYDYSQPGAYFITLCTNKNIEYFGKILHDQLIINEFGKILEQCWYDLVNHYDNLQLDEYVVMPNHFHCIMIIPSNEIYSLATVLRPVENNKPVLSDHEQNKTGHFPRHGITEFVRALKSFSSRSINTLRRTTQPSIWQNNYYEHIIRNEKSLYEIRKYIQWNPMDW